MSIFYVQTTTYITIIKMLKILSGNKIISCTHRGLMCVFGLYAPGPHFTHITFEINHYTLEINNKNNNEFRSNSSVYCNNRPHLLFVQGGDQRVVRIGVNQKRSLKKRSLETMSRKLRLKVLSINRCITLY